jgi:hypothetical protein
MSPARRSFQRSTRARVSYHKINLAAQRIRIADVVAGEDAVESREVDLGQRLKGDADRGASLLLSDHRRAGDRSAASRRAPRDGDGVERQPQQRLGLPASGSPLGQGPGLAKRA